MFTTISKYKADLIVIMLFFNLLICNELAAQPVFHLAGEAVYNENLVRESKLIRKKVKEKDLAKRCTSQKLQRVKQKKTPTGNNYTSEVKLNKANHVKTNFYKNGI